MFNLNKDNEKDKEEDNNNSPIVNVDWNPPTWIDQFQKFIVDLTGVVDDKDNRN